MPFKNNIITGQSHYSDDFTILKLVDPSVLINSLKNGSTVIPPFQRELDLQKIDMIQDKILKHCSTNWLIQQNPIHLGYIESEITDKLYVIDGQHRIKAIEKILDLQRDIQIEVYDKKIEIIIIKFDTMLSMRSHFLDININSNIEPIYKYFDDEIIKSTILKLKNHLKTQYPESFRRLLKKSDTNHNYHIDEFIRLFIPEEVKNLYDLKNEDYGNVNVLIDKMMVANLMVKQKIYSYQISNIRKLYMTDREYEKCYENSFYLAYDNIDAINFMLEQSDDVNIEVIFKTKHKISTKMKKDVWTKRNRLSMIGKCYVCTDKISFDNFHCGHIIAESNGGKLSLDNLEPICANCNLTMGTENLLEYKNKLINFRNNMDYIKKITII